jgi:outer membrane protein, heavy metal efflux system
MLKKRAALAAASAVTLLYGCANYQPRPLSPADNARALQSRSLDDPRLRQFVAAALTGKGTAADVPLQWRLTTLTLAALYFHPDIKIAQARLATAEAAAITARETPNPVLNLTNNIGQAAVAGAIPVGAAPITIGPVIDLVLETAGKREARTARAADLAEAARWDIAMAEWQVRGRVRDALLNIWAAQQRASFTRRRLALQDQLVQLLDHRLAEGAASALDVGRERIARAEITLALSNLDRDAAEARARLATAIGIPAEKLDGVAPVLNEFDHLTAPVGQSDVRRWRREALTRRSDVQASLAEYEATQAALRLAVADQYPNVTLGPGYIYDLGVNRYILNLLTTLPIFHQNQGRIAEALAKREQAAAIFTALQAKIIGTIDRAEADYENATKSVAVGNAMLADGQHRAEQVETAFRAGQVDRPALLTTQLEVAATALSRFDAVVQQRQALGALEDALQRPLYEPEAHLPPPVRLPS